MTDKLLDAWKDWAKAGGGDYPESEQDGLMRLATSFVTLEQRVSEPKLSDAWQCQSCGCYFPHIPQVLDNDVKRCSKCVQVEVLEQQAEKWELEAKRLYGVGQDIEEMRVALEADNKERDRLPLAAAVKYTGLETKLSKMGDDLREADDRFDRIQDEFVQPYAALQQRVERLKEQLRDIPGVNLRAKVSVLRLWAEPEMERRAEESRRE